MRSFANAYYNPALKGEKRPAGLRTHILVSVGATLAMITNIYLHKIYNGETDLSRKFHKKKISLDFNG